MLSITISEDASTREELAAALRAIADKVEQGITKGFYPHFIVEGDEEEEN